MLLCIFIDVHISLDIFFIDPSQYIITWLIKVTVVQIQIPTTDVVGIWI